MVKTSDTCLLSYLYLPLTSIWTIITTVEKNFDIRKTGWIKVLSQQCSSIYLALYAAYVSSSSEQMLLLFPQGPDRAWGLWLHTNTIVSSSSSYWSPPPFPASFHLFVFSFPPSHPFQPRWWTVKSYSHYWPVYMMACSILCQSTKVIISHKLLREVKKEKTEGLTFSVFSRLYLSMLL